MFINLAKWKLQAIRTQVTNFLAITMLQKAKSQTNIWMLLNNWPQKISREEVSLDLGKSQFPLFRRGYLTPPLCFPKICFPPTLSFWLKPCSLVSAEKGRFNPEFMVLLPSCCIVPQLSLCFQISSIKLCRLEFSQFLDWNRNFRNVKKSRLEKLVSLVKRSAWLHASTLQTIARWHFLS